MICLPPSLLPILLLLPPTLSSPEPQRPIREVEPRREAIKEGWSDRAELAYAVASGNAGSRSLGFRNTLSLRSNVNLFFLDVGGHRASNTRTERVAVGERPDDVEIFEREISTVTAERLFARTKYDRELTRRFYLFAAGGWERNRFSGIENRAFIAAGVGNIWLDSAQSFWRTDYGYARIRQAASVSIPGREEGFPALRTTSTFWTKLSRAIRFDNHTILDFNLTTKEDFRLDMTNAVEFRLVGKVALKVSLELLYANDRSVAVAFRQLPTGELTGERVLVRVKGLDTFTMVALVLDF